MKKHLSRTGSADTIVEEPGQFEKKVGQSTHQFNSPEPFSYDSVSHTTSNVRLDNKLQMMSLKNALGNSKKSQIVA